MIPDDTRTTAEPHPVERRQPVRILIVEDVTNVAAVLKARLESYGYDVCGVAPTGPLAIVQAEQCRPDLILMDILLEGDMNGIQAAEQIGTKLDVPIIFLSCINDQKLLDRALQVRPYGFILKPYDHNELRFNIENALAKHKEELRLKETAAGTRLE